MKVFVSYRRKTWPFTHRLADDLRKIIDGEIFVDFSGIDEADFERAILSHLRSSDAVMLVISPETFTDRIHRDEDWVRREIALALELKKPIVLVCVDGLLPPAPGDLPENIRDLTRMQGINFYPEYWDAAVQRLAEFVAKVTPVTLAGPATVDPATAAPPLASKATLDEAVRLLETGDFDKAIFLLDELKEAGFKSRFVNVEAVLGEAIRAQAAEQRRRDAAQEYEAIRSLAGSKFTLAQARAAWVQFQESYPDFEDSANLSDRLKVVEKSRPATPKPSKAPPMVSVSHEQQVLLAVMLDIKRPPTERAEAGRKLSELGDPRAGVGLRPDGLPDIVWCDIPAGEFLIGRNKKKMTLPAYRISKYPITYTQYKAFLDAPDGYANAQWWQEPAKRQRKLDQQPFRYANHPAEHVSWYDVMAYCAWLTARLGAIELPTREQWEKAARGTDGRVYPYGDTGDGARANTRETGIGQTTTVGIFPNGASPYGVLDMSGNVWEWTLTSCDVHERYICGGSYVDDLSSATVDAPNIFGDDDRSTNIGFRVACAAPG